MKTPPASSWFIGMFLAAASGMTLAQNLPAPEQGTQIGWATEAFATNYMADGVTTFEEASESIRFELGTFSPGFDPTTATPDQWVANWIVLQGADYDLVDQQVIQTATLSSNHSPFTQNTQAYIWGYTSKNVDPTSQWLLVAAPSWKWPSANSPLPTTFSMSDAKPQDAIMGSVNPENEAYHMQFEYVAIPEPSAAVLACAASVGLLLRRRR
ncbi:MAG: hypothetical protein EOP85_16705 [Verrucomicrobiaceae bacterium]|nr:MAG: hypothetical protein EOP85_16705 [Verrucomicrobiaceae bacterium]